MELKKEEGEVFELELKEGEKGSLDMNTAWRASACQAAGWGGGVWPVILNKGCLAAGQRRPTARMISHADESRRRGWEGGLLQD